MKTFNMLNIEKLPHLQARYTNRPQHVLLEWYDYKASFSKHGGKTHIRKMLEEKNHGTLEYNSDDYLLTILFFFAHFFIL